jgi:hypothetical protein
MTYERRIKRQRARRRALTRLAGAFPVEYLDLYWEELQREGVAGDLRLEPKPQWWKPGEAPNRWESSAPCRGVSEHGYDTARG